MRTILDLPNRNASCNSIIVILENDMTLKKIISENVGTHTHNKSHGKKDTRQYAATGTNISKDNLTNSCNYTQFLRITMN